MKKILVIASHPDDEVLGCGGTISRLVREGNVVHIMILGEGITSRSDKRNKLSSLKNLSKLNSDSMKAGKILGAKSVETFDLPDNRFDSIDLLDIVKIIENKKKSFEPEIIFTHHHADLNVDHRLTFEATLIASRPIRGESVKEIYSFEIPSSTEWQFQTQGKTFTPNVYNSILKKDLLNKIKAMQIYSSEKRAFPHPRSPQALEALAKWRGSNSGYDFAECFELVRIIK